MKVSISIVTILVVIGVVNSQYNYPKPAEVYTYSAPKDTYLPPPAPTARYIPPPLPITRYVAPAPPKNTYLPPPRPTQKYLPPPPSPTVKYLPPATPAPKYLPPVTERAVASVYAAPSSAEHEPGMPYDFTYSVKEDAYANDYSRSEQSDGDTIKGEYRTLLPDGRTQVVRYTADWKNGYNAVVSYEGSNGRKY